MLDLILKDIDDEYSRENFFRLRKFLSEQVLFEADFKLFDVTINKQDAKFRVEHGLTFIPTDIIPLAVSGDYNFYFKYQEFDKRNMYISANGPVRVRFLAGKLSDKIGRANNTQFPFVAPGDVISAAGPSFVYGAVGAKTSGFWLTSEGIPSNISGVPVLFSDSSVILSAVGAEFDANYTIGVYQHDGQGINLTQIGTFAATIGGPKRFELSFPIVNSSPNVQLACRLEVGNTQNLKVSLVIRGAAI